jgi:catechol 2,3-dioxygenase-like lactoylglutathione lyase family enzyme
MIQVADLDATIEVLPRAGVHCRDDRPTEVAVRQVLLEDPSGNPIELFESRPSSASAEGVRFYGQACALRFTSSIPEATHMSQETDTVHVRYMVDDVASAVDFYTTHLGFTVLTDFGPAFADVKRGNLRLLLSGPTSSAGRPMPDGRQPGPGGWNRIHLLVDDINAEVARLRAEGVSFRNDVVSGPGGKQILIDDPSGNPIELFQPTAR